MSECDLEEVPMNHTPFLYYHKIILFHAFYYETFC